MNKINFDWENCYGIKELKEEFSFEKSHVQLIYAPNGTMKTSFANTMRFIETDKNKPQDRLDTTLVSKCDVKVDGVNIPKECVYVINGDDEIDSSAAFVNFLASKELKQRYDDIYAKIIKEKDALMSKLGTISQSSDCEKELMGTFRSDENTSIFTILYSLSDQLNKPFVHFEFKYNAIFDKNDAVKGFVEKYRDNLKNYIEQYNTLLSRSTFYQKKDGYSFGTFQASQLYDSVEDKAFFAVNHKIVLQNNEEISTAEALQEKIKEEQEKIMEDKNLKKIFDTITKAIDRNANLRGFKSVIESHPDWILEIIDFEEFRKKVWFGHLACSEIKPFYDAFINVYNSNKKELESILREARGQQDKWKEIITLYKSRFHVPFDVEIENQEDIILKSESAKLKFSYIDGNGHHIETNKDKLDLILSRGEKRAFIILQFIFDMESRKSINQETLLVMDDIADSFDYQNKYAIIEYIKDLSIGGNFYSLILTHNYDFYRTVSSRLSVKGDNLWIVEKGNTNSLLFHKGQYTGNVYTNAFIGKDDDDKIFIGMLPFVRNLIEYTEGESSNNYLKLTSCLHIKSDTKTITTKEVAQIMEKFTQGKGIRHTQTNDSFYDLVMKAADSIARDVNLDSIKIENKIVLSIAIRLLAEQYMYDVMTHAGKSEQDFATNKSQTGYWTRKMKEFCPNDTNLPTIEEVNIMTPELIHLNSFMYEPLIDMSVNHLLKLYQKCKTLHI